MKIFFVLLTLIVTANNCNKNLDDDIPKCIQNKIAKIKSQPKWNPPARVEEYIYNGNKVFLFSSNCCDQYSELYDENCNLLCAPSGGISGGGDGKCNEFFTSATLVKLVWKDER